MPVVAVVNRKGGSGKSTLATHLAAWCSTRGMPVLLGDVDRQQSTQTWLKQRSRQALPQRPKIVGWNVDPKTVVRPPAGIAHVVLDTPGGLRGFDLARVVMYADAILMPVCNSLFDRESAAECYAELLTMPRIASGRCRVAAVGMRIDARTRGADVLKQWARERDLPFIGVLRDTHTYVRCAELGLTLFDLPAAKVEADLAQWQPILDWLGPLVLPVPKPAPGEAGAPNARMGRLPVEAAGRAANRGAPAADAPPVRIPAYLQVGAERETTAPAVDPVIPAAASGARVAPTASAAAAEAAAGVAAEAAATPRVAEAATVTEAPTEKGVERTATARTQSARARPVTLRAAPPAQPRTLASRLGSLLDALPIPRFLQRNP